MNTPPQGGGWVNADFLGGWTCEVDQGAYGHRARKTTWLYAHGVDLPSLKWGRAAGDFMLLRAVSKDRMRQRGMAVHAPVVTRKECLATPVPFRDLLIDMARSARPQALEQLIR